MDTVNNENIELVRNLGKYFLGFTPSHKKKLSELIDPTKDLDDEYFKETVDDAFRSLMHNPLGWLMSQDDLLIDKICNIATERAR